MSKKKITEKDKFSEVSLFYETMEEIFSLCLERANLTYDDFKWSDQLHQLITEAFPGSPIEAPYIKNIKTRLRLRKYERYKIERRFIEPIASFAGVSNYIALNEKYNTMDSEVLVLYTEFPFHYFNFIRVTEAGNLTKTKDGWIFKGSNFSIGADHVTTIIAFEMPGDHENYWIKITYQSAGKTKTAYFAEFSRQTLQKQNPFGKISRLFNFFLK